MIDFRLVRDTGKTTIWDLSCNEVPLGQIRWYPNWRRYCFYPLGECLFDSSCMKEITSKLDQLMNDRRCLAETS